jgi:hypothetical protein
MATTNVTRADGAAADASARSFWRRLEGAIFRAIREFPIARLREFFWLASGMFSASALFLAFLGYFVTGAADDAARNFAAAVASSVLFGTATILKLGPESS